MPVTYIPTKCPICRQQIWSGETMASPVPRLLYQDHLARIHPEFARWDKRMMTFFLPPVIIVVIVSALLFVGSLAGDRVGSTTPVFVLFFATSLGLVVIFGLSQERGKRKFRTLWNQTHPMGAGGSLPPEASSKIASPEDYLADLSIRLSNATFKVQRGVRVESYQFDIVAVRPAVQMGGFRDLVIVTTMQVPTFDKIQDFSSSAMKYSLDQKSELGLGSGDNLNLFSVVVSDTFDDEVKKSVSKTRPGGSSMHGRVEFPVLISINEDRAYYYTKTPISGGLRYRALRNFADVYISELGKP